MAKKKKTARRRNARDFVIIWARKYEQTVKFPYVINWLRDGQIFKKLIARFSDRQLIKLVGFAFSGDRHTEYLEDKGYPLPLFFKMVNQFVPHALNSSGCAPIPDNELELDVPYWDDERVSYIFSKIIDSDLDAIIRDVSDERLFHILVTKIKRQDGSVPKKVSVYFERWKSGEPFVRKSMKR